MFGLFFKTLDRYAVVFLVLLGMMAVLVPVLNLALPSDPPSMFRRMPSP